MRCGWWLPDCTQIDVKLPSRGVMRYNVVYRTHQDRELQRIDRALTDRPWLKINLAMSSAAATSALSIPSRSSCEGTALNGTVPCCTLLHSTALNCAALRTIWQITSTGNFGQLHRNSVWSCVRKFRKMKGDNLFQNVGGTVKLACFCTVGTILLDVFCKYCCS